MTPTRYIVKFNNGFHKVFDTETYGDVEKCYLSKDAKELAKKLNANLKPKV